MKEIKSHRTLLTENNALRRKLTHIEQIQKRMELKLAEAADSYFIFTGEQKHGKIGEIVKRTMESLMGNFAVGSAASFSLERSTGTVEHLASFTFSPDELGAMRDAIGASTLLPLLHKPIALHERVWNNFHSDTLALLREMNISVLAPLPIEKNFVVFIMLGERLIREKLTKHDLGFISLITGNTTVILKNLRLVDRYFVQQAEKFHIRGVLEQYVAPELVEQMLNGEHNNKFAGERRIISVVMADIRNFTQIAERTEPEELVAALNEFYSTVSDIVYQNGGAVDKFIGDAVLAGFGLFQYHEDDAQRAVRAAKQMVDAFGKLKKQKAFKGIFDTTGIGIGVCTGEAIIGNLGSGKRLDYTAVGMAVNLAARLCGIATANEILTDEGTQLRLNDKKMFKKLQPVSVKGLAKTITVYRFMRGNE